MKRTKRAAFTAAALLSCTLAFSGCSLISQVVPDQDGTAGEQAEADGQQTEGQQPAGENEAAQDTGAGEDSSDSGTSSTAEGTSTGTDGSNSGTAGSDDGTTGSDAAQSSGSQAEVSIGESFEDPEMQDKIEVLSAVRNFDSSKKATSIELGGEVVLLEVKITPGQKYSGLIQSGAFKISDDGGADYRYDQTDGVEAEMKAAGYEPFEDVTRRDGGTHQGWLAYVPDEKQDTYTIRYERGAGKVMGTDEKIPEFTTTFDIPSA
ncbi:MULTISPECIES: transcriptional regulator [unclassified Brevibacterium]|uniref:transcriptional regulator n=1 Tax=unclassified Brevibacterium TaxID=2614124 RepID=UPI00109279B3|nr:transcriptional regulator [Brevibacterium sp. S22]TGD31682.1 transcriptional regulator [Brevibacterium sp. S22]